MNIDQRLEQAQQDGDFDWLTGQPQGRRILFRMFMECGLFHAVQAPDQLPYGEGGRAYAARWQWLLFSREPDRLVLLLTENAHLVKEPPRDDGDDDRDDRYDDG